MAEGSPLQIAISAIVAILGVSMVAIGLEGYFLRNLRWVQRVLLVIGGVALLTPIGTARLAGLGLAVLVFCWEWISVRRSRQPHPHLKE